MELISLGQGESGMGERDDGTGVGLVGVQFYMHS